MVNIQVELTRRILKPLLLNKEYKFYFNIFYANYCKIVSNHYKKLHYKEKSKISNIRYLNLEVNRNENKKINLKDHFYFHSSCSEQTINTIRETFLVKPNFIEENDESNIIEEIDPILKRYSYEFQHWDDAIHGYREIERQKWNKKCSSIINRICDTAFLNYKSISPQFHILDLSSDGVIKPHIDSVRFCGNIIAGLSLLSDAVMRLVHDKQKDQVIDILLPRFSLYIMKDESRFKYTHEILAKNVSYFGDKYIDRKRRISVICRNHP